MHTGEFWNSNRTLKALAEGRYFSEEDASEVVEWPSALKDMLAEGLLQQL